MLHWWFLYRIDTRRLARAIEEAEKLTSGEIVIFISHRRHDDPLEAAKARFEKLGMARTAQRNAILFYIVPRSRKFAIIGDAGIHARAGDAFWRELADLLRAAFREGRLTEGLEAAVRRAGDLLAKVFPPLADDVNELPNQLSGGI